MQGPCTPANSSAGIAASPVVQRKAWSASNVWKPSVNDVSFASMVRCRSGCASTIRRSATPNARSSRSMPISCGTAARERMRTLRGVAVKRNAYSLSLRLMASIRLPSTSRYRSGSWVNGGPLRDAVRSTSRRSADHDGSLPFPGCPSSYGTLVTMRGKSIAGHISPRCHMTIQPISHCCRDHQLIWHEAARCWSPGSSPARMS